VLAAANDGYGFAEGTFAGTHRNEQDAPEAGTTRPFLGFRPRLPLLSPGVISDYSID
jgi:hypothetical protein